MTAAVAIAVVAVVAFALWGWKTTSDPDDFFVASRRAGPVLAGLAGTAAGLSAFVFVGGPGLFATVGIASLWIILSAPLTGALQAQVVGEPVLDLIGRRPCLTVPELIAARFGEGTPRALASVIVCLGSVATLAVQVKGVAVVGSVLFAVPGWTVALLTVAATTLYTATGGMRTGLLAEAAQGLLMGGVAITLGWLAIDRAGGLTAAVASLQALRPDFLDPLAGGSGVGAISLFLLFALGTCAQPHYVQKFLMLRDRSALRWLPLVATASLFSILVVWIGVGLGGSALVVRQELFLSTSDSLAPALLRDVTGPTLLPLALVGILAAVMSTAASLLNIAAAAVTRDLPAAFGRAPSRTLFGPRCATVLVAAAAAALALGSNRSVAMLGVLGWGTLTAGLFPVIVFGLRWAWTNRTGAIAAMASGLAVQIGLEVAAAFGIGPTALEPGLAGTALGTLVLVVGSLLSSPASDPPRLRPEP